MKYCLCLLLNDNFFHLGSTMLNSFIQNNPTFKGDIVIINDDEDFKLSEENLDILKTLYANIRIHTANAKEYRVNFSRLFDTILVDRYIYCLYKLELFTFEEYDKVLYLDTDMLITQNIMEIFDEWDYDCGVTLEGTLDINEFAYLERVFPVNDFNMGFMYWGKRFLKTEVKKNIFAFSQDVDKIAFSEQTLICQWLEEFVKTHRWQNLLYLVPSTYNTLLTRYIPLKWWDDEERLKSKKILHYIIKPGAINATVNPSGVETGALRLWKRYTLNHL